MIFLNILFLLALIFNKPLYKLIIFLDRKISKNLIQISYVKIMFDLHKQMIISLYDNITFECCKK